MRCQVRGCPGEGTDKQAARGGGCSAVRMRMQEMLGGGGRCFAMLLARTGLNTGWRCLETTVGFVR
jgi:hypothetical protein